MTITEPAPISALTSITRVAPAKVNLALAVDRAEPAGPKRGWHRIKSWFHAIDLGDEVTLTRRASGEPTVLTRFADDAPRPSAVDWNPGCDLTKRALDALGAHIGAPISIHADVLKRIPTGAGLGGGSANAAAALRGARDLLELPVDDDTLRSIGATLGSDIPFFIDSTLGPPRPAIVSRFGDSVRRTERAQGELALAILPVGCPTREVYVAFDALPPAPFRAGAIDDLAATPRPLLAAARLFNDLAVPAEMVQPAVAAVRDAMSDALDAPSHVTGSGSCCFALVQPGAGLAAASAAVAEAVPGTVVVRASLL